jgi:hypothetical protein
MTDSTGDATRLVLADPIDDLAQWWIGFADATFRGYSPLYDRISRAVATDREILEMIYPAPPAAHMPTVLLGAVHYLLLAGVEDPLNDVYDGRSDADPGPLFVAFVHAHRTEIEPLLSTRHTQTNEVGRCSAIVPGLRVVADRIGGPLALIDVGCSAGLNLRCDHYNIDYGPAGSAGPIDAAVRLTCEIVGGRPPVSNEALPIASRVGIDADPVDISNEANARWLLACIFPDTGRLEHTAAAIREAQTDPQRIVSGNALDVLPDVLREIPSDVVPCLVTTQAFVYFSIEQRKEFGELLDDAARDVDRTIAWISCEVPDIIEDLGPLDPPPDDRALTTALGLVTFTPYGRRAEVLGYAQPHGAWLDWRV